MASKKLSTDTSLANSYKLSRGVASVARPSAPTIGTATDGGTGNMSVTFTASTLGPTASSFSLTSSSGVTGSGASSPLTLQEVATGTYTYSVSGVNANGTGPSSAASNSVVVASVFSAATFDSIATTTLSSSASTVTFSSIPATYKHLQVRVLAQTDRGTYPLDEMKVTFNSDSGSNYSWHNMQTDPRQANSSDVTAAAGATQTSIQQLALSSSVASNVFAAGVLDVLDYASANKNKTVRYFGGASANGYTSSYTTSLGFFSGLWMNSGTAISSMTFSVTHGSMFTQHSSFALYGIKGD